MDVRMRRATDIGMHVNAGGGRHGTGIVQMTVDVRRAAGIAMDVEVLADRLQDQSAGMCVDLRCFGVMVMRIGMG